MAELDGRLLVADVAGRELWDIDPQGDDDQGVILRTFPADLSTPIAMCLHNGRLLVVDLAALTLWDVDPQGDDDQGVELRDLPPGLGFPGSMASFNGRLLIADNAGDELWDVDPQGDDDQGVELRDLPPGLNTPGGMAVAEDRLFIADSSGDELWDVDPQGDDDQGVELRDFPGSLTTPTAMTAPGPIGLAGDIESAAPEITGDLTVDAAGVVPLEGEIASADPEITGDLTVGELAALAGDIETAAPEITGDLTVEAVKIPATWIQYIVDIATNPPERFWTGVGRLTYQGLQYEGGGQLINVSNLEVSFEPDRRTEIAISAIPTALRSKFLQDVGAALVTIKLLYSKDNGQTWLPSALEFSGRLSTPTMVDGILSVEIETLRGDIDRGLVLFWSDEDQQKRSPGDLGMSYMRQLAQQGIETGWPP